jgi:hypothetical protein
MVRRLLASVFLAAFPIVVIPIAITSMAAQAGAATPTAVQQCNDGGWRSLADTSGEPFANQGLCIVFVIQHPVGLANVAKSSFTGTTSAIFPAGAGCEGTLASQVFDSGYPGTAPVGTVTLHVGGCIDTTTPPPNLHYSGTFTITTDVGTLNGIAAGLINVDLTSFDFTYDLTLTATAGSGSFAATTGEMHLLMAVEHFVAGPPSFTFSGALSVS